MIFDSLVHPTLSGKFLSAKADTSFESVSKRVKDAGLMGACAVGIAGHNKYNHKEFFAECAKYENLYPVAGFDFKEKIKNEFAEIVDLGFKAIKVHPRLSGASYSDEKLIDVINLAFENNIVVFLCTYNYEDLSSEDKCLKYESLIEILRESKPAKTILLHGGVLDLLKYSELVRNNDNLLLDLSYTFLKFKSSSLDKDIEFLFENFDRRICIGSDYPDFDFN